MNQTNYWIVVASRDHALNGVAQGFVQANHGKPGPLRRMQPGDGVVIYAPKRVYGQTEPYQRFVALGEVSQGPVFQAEVSADFRPFRRQVSYQSVSETPIQPLLEHLSFTQPRASWGAKFRFGCFQIPATDFMLIQSAMTPDSHE
ncbi:EVE domain-containing protein [Spirosoma pulveris]